MQPYVAYIRSKEKKENKRYTLSVLQFTDTEFAYIYIYIHIHTYTYYYIKKKQGEEKKKVTWQI